VWLKFANAEKAVAAAMIIKTFEIFIFFTPFYN
jgi:hypothetical protein